MACASNASNSATKICRTSWSWWISPSKRGDIYELGCAERLGDFDRHGIGVDAICFAVAIESQRRQDRNDPLAEQRLEHLHIDALDFAGKKMVLTVKNAERMRDQGIARCSAKIVGAETFQNFVSQPVGRGQGEFQSCCIS